MAIIEQLCLTVIWIGGCVWLRCHVRLFATAKLLDLFNLWMLISLHLVSKHVSGYSLAPYVIAAWGMMAVVLAVYFAASGRHYSCWSLLKLWWRWCDLLTLVGYLTAWVLLLLYA